MHCKVGKSIENEVVMKHWFRQYAMSTWYREKVSFCFACDNEIKTQYLKLELNIKSFPHSTHETFPDTWRNAISCGQWYNYQKTSNGNECVRIPHTSEARGLANWWSRFYQIDLQLKYSEHCWTSTCMCTTLKLEF